MNINIDYASDDSCQIQLWAKGHHLADGFLAACETALKKWDERVVRLSGLPVRQTHWRTVRADEETRANGVCDYVRKECAPNRGAYKVTVLETWLPLHLAPPAAA